MDVTPDSGTGEGGDAVDRFTLDSDERRVIGVLIEKSLTTPQYYPLTINAVVTGSNQKSNRDPHVQFVDDEVEEILGRLQKRGLTSEHYGAGGRTARWRQEFTYELELDGPQMAVVAELLLRGPQTLGELRTRANRMKPIADLGMLEGVVKTLEIMSPPRMVRLSPAGQKRGVRYTHCFYPAAELAELIDAEASGAPVAAAAPARGGGASDSEVQELRAQVAALTARVEKLESELGITTTGPTSEGSV